MFRGQSVSNRRTYLPGVKTLSAAVIVGGLTLGSAGCNNAVEGGLTGAGLGALTGMAVGSAFGHMGKGAAIGAAAGALGGLIIGDQNERRARGD